MLDTLFIFIKNRHTAALFDAFSTFFAFPPALVDAKFSFLYRHFSMFLAVAVKFQHLSGEKFSLARFSRTIFVKYL